MGSLDVNTLFKITALEETIHQDVYSFFQDIDTFQGFRENELRQFLCLATE